MGRQGQWRRNRGGGEEMWELDRCLWVAKGEWMPLFVVAYWEGK